MFVLSFSLSWELCESFDALILNKFLSRYCNHYQYTGIGPSREKAFGFKVFLFFGFKGGKQRGSCSL